MIGFVLAAGLRHRKTLARGDRAKTLVAIATLGMASAPASATDLTLRITGVRSNNGVLRICLMQDERRFPACPDGIDAVRILVPAGQSDVPVSGLSLGNWAIAVFHDANRNGRLDTVLGIPREGYGFSRNPATSFGPPPFRAARIAVGARSQQLEIRMKYWL